ncbi:hypothetical protein DIPPA_08819 [Diplonema papillatum]|nr:hypothetical protein DIPPA_08819 [Diplonema papillatum]
MYEGGKQPGYGLFKRTYGKHIRREGMKCADLTGADLKQVLMKKTPAAAGRDGHRLQRTGKWPDALLEASVTLIRKMNRSTRWP